jgi:exonuclease III
MDMRFGTWNLRSLYRSGSLMTVVRELARYKLDVVFVQEVRWDKGGTVLSLTSSFRSHYGIGIDSASNRNEYQGYLLGVKAVGA